MAGAHIDLFADPDDLEELFARFDLIGDYQYTRSLSKLNSANEKFDSAMSLLNFLVTYQEPVQTNVFLIMLPNAEIFERKIFLRDGSGYKISVDQNFNPDSMEILLGGEAAASTIVKTTLRTTGETAVAKDIFKSFKKATLKDAKKVQEHYYVMPSALRKLERGWRLTPGIGYDERMDVKIG